LRRGEGEQEYIGMVASRAPVAKELTEDKDGRVYVEAGDRDKNDIKQSPGK